MSNRSKSFAGLFYGKNTIHVMNFIFVIMLLGGAAMLADNSFAEVKPPSAIANPLTSAVILILAVPVISYLVALGSNVDRHCAEDYSFQLMANAALVALATMVFFSLIGKLDFLLELIGLREIQANDLVGITLMSWAVSFFYFQRKGLK
jgi:hypothetical protein